jgi:hypothetical protein
LEQDNVGFLERLDWLQVDTDYFAIWPDKLCGYLQPSARRGAEVNHFIPLIHQSKALLQFDEFIRCAGAITILFSFLEESVLGCVGHGLSTVFDWRP